MYTVVSSLVLFSSFSTVINNILNLNIQDPEHFGPYNLNYTRFDVCAGPRSKNLTTLAVDLRFEGTKYICDFNITFLVQAHLEEVKIVVYSLKNEKIEKVLWTYKLTDPCKHFAFSTLINTYLNAPNCIVNKGTYTPILSMLEFHELFFGKSFFYGKFLMKVTVISKKGNLMCYLVGMAFTKKSVSQT